MNLLGMFKDECESKTLTEWAGLRSKSYCFRMSRSSEDDIVKCKGVDSRWVKANLKMDDYKNVLRHTTSSMASFNGLRSRDHKVYLMEFKKCALNAFDCKRYMLNCGLHARSLGSFFNKDARNNYCRRCGPQSL